MFFFSWYPNNITPLAYPYNTYSQIVSVCCTPSVSCLVLVGHVWPEYFGRRSRHSWLILSLQTQNHTQIWIPIHPTLSSWNGNYPSVVNSYLPISHLVHNIPPPYPGGSIVVVPQNFWAAAVGVAAQDSEKPLLRHDILLSYTAFLYSIYPWLLHCKNS